MLGLEIVQVRPPGRPGAAALDDVCSYLGDFLTENNIPWAHSINTCSSRSGRRILIGGHLLNEFSFLREGDIVVNTEPLMEPKFRANTAYLEILSRGEYRVADYGMANIRGLPAGIDAHWLQFPALRSFSKTVRSDKASVDFVFFGTINEARQAKIEKIKAAGYSVRVLSGVYGSARDEEILKARFALNLHYFASGIFESVRCMAAMRLGRPVVSQWVDMEGVPKPFRGSVCFLSALDDRELQSLSTNSCPLHGYGVDQYLSSSTSASYEAQLNFLTN